MTYTIKEVSALTGLSIPTLRYYDKEGLLPDLRRKESGYRIFSDEDLYVLELIECFKQSGLQIKEIRYFMTLVKEGDATLQERFEIFRSHVERLKEKMESLQKALKHSQDTLDYYKIAARTGSEAAAQKEYQDFLRNSGRRI